MAPYRVGVIGCGGIGIQHATGLVGLDNAHLVAACDLNTETVAAFQDHWAGTWDTIAPYADYRQMLAEQQQLLQMKTHLKQLNYRQPPVILQQFKLLTTQVLLTVQKAQVLLILKRLLGLICWQC